MRLSRRGLIASAAAVAGEAPNPAPARSSRIPDFPLRGKETVEEEHFGAINGHITFGVGYQDSFAIRGLFAAPAANYALAMVDR